MAKRNEEKIIRLASERMLENIKKDFPIDLEKVLAEKKKVNETVVLTYPNRDMEAYREKFVNKYEEALEDVFVFEEYATIWTCDEDGNQYKTGYFCPRMFWNKIFKQIGKNSQPVKFDTTAIVKKYRPSFI